MEIIGEKINGTRKRVALAISERDTEFIQDLAKKQENAGSAWLDINAGTHPSQEPEDLLWLIEKVQEESLRGIPLDTLHPGEKGKVTAISSLSKGVERRRLFDLGIIPGTEIIVEMNSPGGDPTAYRIRGSVIALRSSQARLIKVDPIEEPEKEKKK